MKRVRAQGCHTLYKSQVILSTKDTPLVPKLCITSQHDRILDRPPIILLPTTELFEAMGGIQGASRGIRFTHLEVDLPGSARRQSRENLLHECTSQPVTPTRRRDGQVQDLSLVRCVERHDVPADRLAPFRLGYQKQGIGRHAVAEILCGPRIGEDLLLDRADRRYIAQASGTNSVGVGRSAPPISPELRRA